MIDIPLSHYADPCLDDLHFDIAANDVDSFKEHLEKMLQNKLIKMKNICKLRKWMTATFKADFERKSPVNSLENVLSRADRIIRGISVQPVSPPPVSFVV